MLISLKQLDPNTRAIIEAIGDIADEDRIPVYVVGGAVRDLLLKKSTKDIDIVVEGDAVKLARKISRVFDVPVKAYAAFKTATLFLEDGLNIDFVSARTERYTKSGALPTVSEGALQDDLFRRDFTINALAFSINCESFGEIFDFYEGLSDLKAGKIKVMHDKSFVDDPTRILRAIRYEQRFGFRLDRSTLSLLKQALDLNVFDRISIDRYINDFERNLQEVNVQKIVARQKDLGVAEILAGDMTNVVGRVKGIQARIKKLKRQMLKDDVAEWFIYFLAHFEDCQLASDSHVMSSSVLNKHQKKCLLGLSEMREFRQFLTNYQRPLSEVYRKLTNIPMELVWYLKLTTGNKKVDEKIDQYRNVRTLTVKLNGDDLKVYGLDSGRHIGTILNQILWSKIDGEVKSRRDEVRMAKSLVGQYKSN